MFAEGNIERMRFASGSEATVFQRSIVWGLNFLAMSTVKPPFVNVLKNSMFLEEINIFLEEEVMRNWIVVLLVVMLMVLVCGCDSFRFAPGEVQKANAWLHQRTAQMAADVAKAEETSPELVGLAELSEVQSRAFVADYGLPGEYPPADTVEDVLGETSRQIAGVALSDSLQRPDAWEIADGMIELGIAVAGILGGAYGIRTAQFLRKTKEKSTALREIIQGNEQFKRQNAEHSTAFKSAHQSQSPKTRQIVAAVKGE